MSCPYWTLFKNVIRRKGNKNMADLIIIKDMSINE